MATVYEQARAIKQRFQYIATVHNQSADTLVIADLREGKPAIVARRFKFGDREWVPGEKFHPGMSAIGKLLHVMENQGRILITEAEYTDRQEWTRLKPIVAALEPMVDRAADLSAQAKAARIAQKQAEEAARKFKGEAQTAESDLAKAEKALAEYIAGLNGDVSKILKEM